ncbi:MAG: GNAT family N-acetyltransferase [Pelatocladus maniniholoensis HA4357-MV3]|jgi:amino-acid N-acetyltransferase|uniref:GNAT family N-acetyltransferase n=1 Tax=Pelatocladus maniniholoensis HA4357-MV3 TaxID=1117104 RepID=A0A9E3H4E0_9NOST|nr:GNAT family N-acetyltransferase [Pelatocladus maniniholoensis HA4357-MV3]
MKKDNLSLPTGCILRQAIQSDTWSIRWLVLSAKLDPTQLIWQQFWVIECDQKIVACGQLRNFSDAQELGSLVVKQNWRDRNLGSILTQHLIQAATQPLYLECLGQRLANFYYKFGFVPIAFENLPRSLQRKFQLSELGRKLGVVPVVLMHYQDS